MDQYQLRVGGALGNAALALHALGANAEYIANVGDDALGTWLQGELKRHGCQITVSPGSTAVTVGIIHPNSERTFFTHPGHLSHFDPQPALEAAATLGPGDLLLVCGYFLLPKLRTQAVSILQTARERSATTLLDTGWPTEGWDAPVRDEVLALLAACDYFLPNREELLALTGTSTIVEGLRALKQNGACRTIVKLGPEGAATLEPGGVERVAAPSVSVQDTIGAGDTFNATFAYALSQGRPLHEAIRLAVQGASTAIASRPRRYPTLAELEQ